MNRYDLHFTTRRPTIINWVIPIVAVIALVIVYAGVQLYNDNIDQRAQIQAFKARGCPDTWRGRPFAFSAEETLILNRPGTMRIACYYKMVKA